MDHPELYHETQRSDFFNKKVSLWWVVLSILHSMVLFWIPMMVVGNGEVWASGFSGDILVLGNIVYTCVIITVNLKAGLELDSWNWLLHLSIWGSMAVWIIMFWFYSQLWSWGVQFGSSNVPASMSNQFRLVLSSPTFYFCALVVPVSALLLDLVAKYLGMTHNVSLTNKARIEDRKWESFQKRKWGDCEGEGMMELKATMLNNGKQTA